MQDVNNDMDDLFRKAADHYPLQTNSADWNTVLKGLQDNSDDAATVVADGGKKRGKRTLWLLWLLPLCLLFLPLRRYVSGDIEKEKTVLSASSRQKDEKEKSNPATTFAELSSADASKRKIDTLHSGPDHHPSAANNSRFAQSFIVGDKRVNGNGAVTVRNKKISADEKNDKITSASNQRKNIVKREPENSTNTINGEAVTLSKNNSDTKQPDEAAQRIQPVTAEDGSTAAGRPKKDTATAASVAGKGDSAVARNTKKDDKKKKTKSPQTQWQPGFYGGIGGSFDISTIKLQRINKSGYGLQVLAGYRFSKHLSAETGAGWNLKNYYSKGKYFDKKKAGIPNAVNIYFTNGDCQMFEVPLNIKYDFALRKKSSLFVTAGFSSYFMKKENYSYTGDYMGWVYDTTRHYNNSGANWFSVTNLSIGYQTALGKQSSLRIEPYIKLPLHGTGIANLPVTSTGISVSFTRKF